MTMRLTKATRRKTKMKLGLAGVSGSGKTYSALLLAQGLAGNLDKVAVIDTENGSADLYAHLGEYSTLSLDAPYTPERYVEAIEVCEKSGAEVIIIDSMSHEWDGKGGILEMHSNMVGNSFTNWGKLTPRHNKFIDKILQSPAHIICTMRSKQDYILNEKDGKQVPQKVGLKAITREGVDYEFTLVFDIDIKHNAIASKDRTGLFVDKPEFVISKDTGKSIKKWTEQGTEPTTEKEETTESKKAADVETSNKRYLDTVKGKAKSRAYYAAAKEAGYDAEQAKKMIKTQYKLESFNDAEKEQLETMTAAMKKKAKENNKKQDIDLDHVIDELESEGTI